MSADEYDKVERPAIEQLQHLGWDYLHGTTLSPENSDERNYLSDVVLEKRLARAIKRINPWISAENQRKIMRDLIKPQTIGLMETNQALWQSLTQYLSVEQDLGKGRRGQTVKIIDFEQPENNEFLCVNQFVVKGVKQKIIPDIVLFVNGLPLAVIECKSPYLSSDPMKAGIDQLMRYSNRLNPEAHDGAEKLFVYNQMLVSTHRDKAKVGTISSQEEHFLEWKDPYPLTAAQVYLQTLKAASNDTKHQYPQPQVAEAQPIYTATEPHSQALLIASLFSKNRLLDMMQNFTVFETEKGKTLKKIPRYQQFRAVYKTIERLKNGNNKKDKSGVIWHTQGSGKSLTMVFLTLKMRRDPHLSQYKLVFITDRTQLDNQLTATFQRTQNETVYQAQSVAHLKTLLQKNASDIQYLRQIPSKLAYSDIRSGC